MSDFVIRSLIWTKIKRLVRHCIHIAGCIACYVVVVVAVKTRALLSFELITEFEPLKYFALKIRYKYFIY